MKSVFQYTKEQEVTDVLKENNIKTRKVTGRIRTIVTERGSVKKIPM